MFLQRVTHSQGVLWRFGDFLIFFGNKKSDLESLKVSFKDLDFADIKQVHGNHAIESRSSKKKVSVEADGHWTNHENLALVIKTADCIPIFIVDPMSRSCAGVHAGWRGLASEVLKCTLMKSRQQLTSEVSELYFFIGPHIQKNSFEIEVEVANQILRTVSEPNNYFRTDVQKKSYLDLNLVIRRQIIELGGVPDKIFGEIVDTKTDERFCSYRRDGATAERQNNFIFLRKPNI